MNIIHSFSFFILSLILCISQVFAKIQVIYEINAIPINNSIFEAGVNNQIRVSLWSRTRNYPVSLEEMEEINNSLIEIMVFSKDLRSYSHFNMEDFPHYNNETNLPTTANYFDFDYVFPIAGNYTISIKCKPYRKTIRVNQEIHVEGKKEERMNLDSALLPMNPDKPKIIYFRPLPLENIQSIYRLPIILHRLFIKEKDLKKEVEKATGPIYGTKITIKNTLRRGFCSNTILEFFRVDVQDGRINEIPVNDLFQYNDIPIKAVLGTEENPEFDVVQGNIIDDPDERFPSCGSEITPPKEMVYGPYFGFSLPFRNEGLYRIVFEIAHSFNDNTYLLTPNILVRVTENGDDEGVNFEPADYFDDDENYDQFIQEFLDKQVTAPTDEAPASDDKEDQKSDDTE